jgi:hypothetical protein
VDPRAQVRRFGRVVVDVEKAIADEEALFESIALILSLSLLQIIGGG